MRIAVLGAGFTGLAASLRLLQQGHEVTLIEKENTSGGLAGGFKEDSWDWTLEKSYHHWFTNDAAVLNLAKEMGQKVIIKLPKTDVLVEDQAFPFDSPLSVLTFPKLSLSSRLRTGLAAFYLKLVSSPKTFEENKALPWIEKFMGKEVTELIWEPLFTGKFGKFKNDVALTWFWARIKKRTPSLAYPERGFQDFADKLTEKIKELGGEILLGSEVKQINSSASKVQLTCTAKPRGFNREFDIVISTLPSSVFTRITPHLPKEYTRRINSIPHLSALNLILVLEKPFLQNSYWLNITDKNFPFLVLAEHTNFMDSCHYGNQHILYIGNYLPSDHPHLKMSARELLKAYDPYLKKIGPSYHLSLITYHLFSAPFAQPVVTHDYPKLIPQFQTPLKNIYLANMDMVYPWDRGTNYAVEMGEKVAELVE